MFNLSEFNSVIQNNGGVQRPSLWMVDIGIPPGLLALSALVGNSLQSTNLKFFCYSTNLPGMQIATVPVRRYGYGPTEEKPVVPVFSSLQTRFICDGHGAIWNFFNTWMKFIANFDARQGMNTATGFSYVGTSTAGRASPNAFPYEVAYKRDYAIDMTLSLFGTDGNETVSVVLRDAWPRFVGDVGLDWQDKASFLALPVEMIYTDWYNTILPGSGQVSFSQAASTLSAIQSLNINKSTVQLSTNNLNTYITNLQSLHAQQ